jgi:hypothetical protein
MTRSKKRSLSGDPILPRPLPPLAALAAESIARSQDPAPAASGLLVNSVDDSMDAEATAPPRTHSPPLHASAPVPLPRPKVLPMSVSSVI